MVFCCILHCFVANFFFVAIFAVLSHDRFLRFTRYYVEKNLAKNSARGEKMTNMRYASGFFLLVRLFIVARECHQLVSQKKQQEVFFYRIKREVIEYAQHLDELIAQMSHPCQWILL